MLCDGGEEGSVRIVHRSVLFDRIGSLVVGSY